MRRLWLEAYERLVRRAAHDIRNPLNGVAVNLAVVRQRVAAGAPPDRVGRFADAACADLERAVARVDALLALARPADAAIDLFACLGHLTELYGAAFAAAGGTLVLGPVPGAPAETNAPADAVRLALVSALDAATRTPATVRVTARPGDAECAVHVQVEPAESRSLAVSAAVRDALAELRITMRDAGNEIRIVFPTGGSRGAETPDDESEDSHRG